MALSPIRFGLQAGLAQDPRAWRDLAAKAEDCGFDAFYVADHPGVTAAPFPALAAAAAATTLLKLGTYVLNAGVRGPLEIASDAATVDVISDGRLVLGIGAGHTPAEWTMSGLEYPTPGARVGRLVETVDAVKRLLAGEVVTMHGRYIDLDDAFLLAPRPSQPRVPMLIGGNGAQVLRLAGRSADIVSMTGTGRTLEDGHRHEVDWSEEAITASVARVHDAAAERASRDRPVLDALVQYAAITEDRAKVAEGVARRVPGATAAGVLGSPYVLIGTLDQLTEEVSGHYERWGFASYVVRTDAIDAVAALIEHLRSI